MNCPYCESSQVMVVNSRKTSMGSQVWRRRRCNKCKLLFTTHENVNLTHLVVIKKDGIKERYSRSKLYSGVYSAAVSSRPRERRELVDKIVREAEKRILLLNRKEITSEEIGDMVLHSLKKLSPGVFLGYLTYHKNIEKTSQIKKEIKKYL
ncbi:transcriptional repressor NrdR [Candidatus Microgenomates bacterium]|nr:transcriptional repressor NrdR [Candidatus Microgenomates bacterium]